MLFSNSQGLEQVGPPRKKIPAYGPAAQNKHLLPFHITKSVLQAICKQYGKMMMCGLKVASAQVMAFSIFSSFPFGHVGHSYR